MRVEQIGAGSRLFGLLFQAHQGSVQERSTAESDSWDCTGCHPLLVLRSYPGGRAGLRDVGEDGRLCLPAPRQWASSPSTHCAFTCDTCPGNSISAPGNWHHCSTVIRIQRMKQHHPLWQVPHHDISLNFSSWNVYHPARSHVRGRGWTFTPELGHCVG